MIQTEFEYTKIGALMDYNKLLDSHLRATYMTLIDGQQNPHYIPNERAFRIEWLKSPNHRVFAEKYGPILFEQTVEKQNDSVLRQFNSLETLLPKEE
jgi:hypothetical protein